MRRKEFHTLLFLLVPLFSQPLLPLVRCHFMALALLSAGHDSSFLEMMAVSVYQLLKRVLGEQVLCPLSKV